VVSSQSDSATYWPAETPCMYLGCAFAIRWRFDTRAQARGVSSRRPAREVSRLHQVWISHTIDKAMVRVAAVAIVTLATSVLLAGCSVGPQSTAQTGPPPTHNGPPVTTKSSSVPTAFLRGTVYALLPNCSSAVTACQVPRADSQLFLDAPGQSLTTRTDRNGKFAVRLPPGEYDVAVESGCGIVQCLVRPTPSHLLVGGLRTQTELAIPLWWATY